jgi:SAM-dependent methyltransferase
MINEYFKLMGSNGYYSSGNKLKFYVEYLFKNINFKNKSLIDIGGGNGLFSFFCVLNGAKKAVVMEPEFEGSSNGMIEGFHKIKDILGNPKNIEHTNCVLEDYDTDNNQFDIILMHNSINHIDEDGCIVLKTDIEAQKKYIVFFNLLRKIAHKDSTLIVCDCARSNFFGDIGLKNMYAPDIEWQKHQNPEVWINLLAQSGFTFESLEWTSPNAFFTIGRYIFGNRFIAYFTSSHFKLVFKVKN